jgi:hypothetical protein
MAIGVQSNLKIFQDQFYGGFIETLSQNSNVFNAQSANAIRLFTNFSKGYYFEEAFFEQIANLVARRDITSTSTLTPVNLSADSMIAPKRFSSTPLVMQTLSSLKTAGYDLDAETGMQRFSFIVGTQVAKAMLDDMLNTSLSCAVATLGKSANTSLSIVSASGTKTMNYESLNNTTFKLGDNAGQIVAYVMHSKQAQDLINQSIGIVTDRVAGATIYQGVAGTFGRPLIVTDSTSLVKADGVSTGVNSYYALALREGALDLRLSEQPIVSSDVNRNYVAGIALEYRSDFAYNIRVAGFSMTANNTNPTDAQLANGGNWTQAFTDFKQAAGARLETR